VNNVAIDVHNNANRPRGSPVSTLQAASKTPRSLDQQTLDAEQKIQLGASTAVQHRFRSNTLASAAAPEVRGPAASTLAEAKGKISTRHWPQHFEVYTSSNRRRQIGHTAEGQHLTPHSLLPGQLFVTA